MSDAGKSAVWGAGARLSEDRLHMRHALSLARRTLGRVAPNPAVGCVLVRQRRVIARGYTRPGGRPHAEAVALSQAGRDAQGATAYVTLEPCAHEGETPSCARLLAEAGIARAVIALDDPDPRTAGKGLAILRQADIETVTGVMEEDARCVTAGFLSRVTMQRPLFTLKSAASLDGRIALANGTSRWITNSHARIYGHWLRASHDAILVGIGTALADDPLLDCRIPGLENRSPIRVVLDTHARLPAGSRLVQSARTVPVWLVHAAGEEIDPALAEAGVTLVPVTDPHDLAGVANSLATRGLTRVLVEGGGTVMAGFLKAGLADRLVQIHAPCLLGGDARPAFGALELGALERAPRFRLATERRIGTDRLACYVSEG
ncbi:bifunctional diaminohydroxyphosphoribosylaminopyrimidine deaminase/5-amino-6-(5-phosphoribosylamino)uracil reductase RibD [Eilatimonas milleporae]|uniref:Riboflavin biosynthesis protein RibD n=1 Tax=Eilatimonas milleporae TaxID=911205 RepID=A0A3M0CJC9_9PROT|nr:bifunctional diaminohydroxyphosphoribosylaminopyrimidine deaminase/5-amino-6-(5-phosphoribosylamino)uracil reductase RibD [Eilatimonas milleporae]RMB08887.1 diaminohydroxyphosphoribosylaminopyrimidine deaminase/5-amino-6-(5-phosphoribosylamino)uracil reductase [Eilatimonas milleporae]